MFSACSFKGNEANATSPYIYNGLPREWITCQGSYLYDRTKNPTKMLNLKTNHEYDFIRDPFFEYNQDANPVIYIFTGQKYLYYLISNEAGSFEIIRRDYQTFEEKNIYKKAYYKRQSEIFLGATHSIQPNTDAYLNAPIPHRFCVFDENLFLFYDNQIDKVDLRTKKQITICSDGIYNDNYSYYKGILYFISDDYSLYAYRNIRNDLEKVDGIKAQNLLVTPNGIFYSNANDKGKLYFVDTNYEGKAKLSDITVLAMDFYAEQLYYISESDDHIYTINFNGTNQAVLCDVPGAFSIYHLESSEELCIAHTNSEGDFIIQKHTAPLC